MHAVSGTNVSGSASGNKEPSHLRVTRALNRHDGLNSGRYRSEATCWGEGENFSTRPAPDPLPESSAGALKMQDLKMKDQMSGHEDAGLSTKAAVATRKAKFIRRCLLNSSVVFEICSLIVK